jgi:hypothetical protein
VIPPPKFTTHVAREKRGSAIDGRTTRHRSYAVRLRRRQRIEESYRWMKDDGGLAKLRHRGRADVSAAFAFSCAACKLVRMRALPAEPGARGSASCYGRARSTQCGGLAASPRRLALRRAAGTWPG